MLWKKTYELSLNRVRDTVRVREGAEAVTLEVDADPMKIVNSLNAARAQLTAVTNDSPAEEQEAAARTFASAIFGAEQAEKLMALYRNDAVCVINVCGRYFGDRLSKLIAEAQKKA